jgi:hypothetical protein
MKRKQERKKEERGRKAREITSLTLVRQRSLEHGNGRNKALLKRGERLKQKKTLKLYVIESRRESWLGINGNKIGLK